MELEIKIDAGGIVPSYAHKHDACLDIRTPYSFEIPPRGCYAVPTKLHMDVPNGHSAHIYTKSRHLKRMYTDGTIDAGYQGEITVILHNLTDDPIYFDRGDAIAQIEVHEVDNPTLLVVENFSRTTERGNGGFGSTGR